MTLLCFQDLQISFSMTAYTPELRPVSHCNLQMSYEKVHTSSPKPELATLKPGWVSLYCVVKSVLRISC